MNILDGVNNFFGLDIGTTAVRAVQLSGSGSMRNFQSYGQLPVDSRISLSDADADRQKLAQIIQQLVSTAQINSTNVAVNLPSNKVFSTVIDFDKLSEQEMGKAINYQADSLVPTPLAKSKLDWAILGPSPRDPQKVEVLISSVANEFVESRINLLESIGLNVIACEPDNLALSRSLLPPDAVGAQLVMDIGYQATDLIVAVAGAPRLTRSISIGTGAVIKAAMQNLSVDVRQAAQYVFKFGLSRDKLEGQVYNAIIGTVDSLMSEIDKSIKFFGDRYAGVKIERIIVTGGASSLPELPAYIANQFGLNVEIGNAWRNVTLPPDKETELLSVSNYFAVAVGLAERNI